MKIVALSVLKAFIQKHPDAEAALLAWYAEAAQANWRQPADIKAQFKSASILKNRRVVFNIKGNDYRLIVAIAYQTSWLFIKFIGTHADYDKVDAERVELDLERKR